MLPIMELSGRARMYSFPERVLVSLTLGVVVWCAWLAMATPIRVDWNSFIGASLVGFALLSLGAVLRQLGRAPITSIALVTLGLYALHANVIALVTYLHFPLARPRIDEALIAVDAFLGYEWASAVAWLAQYPRLAGWMALVYASSLLQVIALMLWLAFTRRAIALQALALTGMISVSVAALFWSLWPSFGPSASASLAPELAEQARLVVRPEYGAQLLAFAEHGFEELSQHMILGTIAFPSFHVVMMLMVLVYAHGTRLFWPFTLLNLPMVPAVAIHGGHHLVDLPAGALVFALAAWVSARVLRFSPQQSATPLPRALAFR